VGFLFLPYIYIKKEIMKHLLNEMSEDEKNSIRSQHTDSISINTENFKKLVENKLGNSKPLINEDSEEKDEF
jgi:hypothetical protein